MTSASSRSRLNMSRSPGPPMAPLVPSVVAPPSTLVMKLARTHVPLALGVAVEARAARARRVRAPTRAASAALPGAASDSSMGSIAARRYSSGMHGSPAGRVAHLVDRHPTVSPERLIAQLRPPPTFADVSFATYRPDPAEPTQAAAVGACEDFCRQAVQRRAGRRKPFGRRAVLPGIGLYLDGGFGVGKTHLLAVGLLPAPRRPEPQSVCDFWRADPARGGLRLCGMR